MLVFLVLKMETAKRLVKEDIVGRIITPASKIYDQVNWNELQTLLFNSKMDLQ